MVFYESQRDPVDNSIADTFHWKSTSSTGSSTTIFDDLIVPSSPNFPQSTAIRYMINLPGEPYYAGVLAATHPFVLADVTSTTILTRVAPTATLTANTYKLFPATAETPGRTEVHVGSSSVTAGDTLAYDGYFINSIISSTDMNTYSPQTILSSEVTITRGRGVDYNSTGSTSLVYLQEVIYEIGIWDMEAASSFAVPHDLSDITKIVNIRAIIIDDTESVIKPLTYFDEGFPYAGTPLMGGIRGVQSTYVQLARSTNGVFDSGGLYDSTTINRGYVYLTYMN